MRVATWNVNGLRARLDFVLRWLGTRLPDLVGLQELKLEDARFPHDAFAAAGYRALVHGQKSWNGVAVLARAPEAGGPVCALAQAGLPGQETLGARLLSVDAEDAAGGALRFTTVYVPNGKGLGHDDFPRKLAWLDALAAHLAASWAPERPLVVCGDLNVCPGPLDSWNEQELAGSLFHSEDERARLRRLFEWGLVDVFRALHPDTQEFSWWDYRGGAFHRKQGLRIDLLLATRPVAARARAVEIDREWRKKVEGLTPSDHAPVVADLV